MAESEVMLSGFDYRTVIRDAGTGKVLREQHYIRHISGSHGGSHSEFMERDGKFYAPNGAEIADPRIPLGAKEEIKTAQVEVKSEKKTEVSFTKKD